MHGPQWMLLSTVQTNLHSNFSVSTRIQVFHNPPRLLSSDFLSRSDDQGELHHRVHRQPDWIIRTKKDFQIWLNWKKKLLLTKLRDGHALWCNSGVRQSHPGRREVWYRVCMSRFHEKFWFVLTQLNAIIFKTIYATSYWRTDYKGLV